MFVRQASVIVLIREYLRSVAVSALGGAGESRPGERETGFSPRPNWFMYTSVFFTNTSVLLPATGCGGSG
jgi:hypothetical protein